MARDIEEFLRKAAERRQQQKQGNPPPPDAPASPQTRPQSSVSSPASFDRSPSGQPIIEPEIVTNAEIVETRRRNKKKSGKQKRESVAEHVDRYMDTSEIRQKTASLGAQVAQTKDAFETTVYQHLNHDICSIDDDRDAAGAVSRSGVNPVALELKKMLAQPESVRQAILISEVLNRPSFEDD